MTRERAIRDGLIAAGVLFNATFLVFWTKGFDFWVDAHAWSSFNLSDLYGAGNADPSAIGGAFRYAPVMAWLMVPLTWLAWPALIGLYLALSAVALAILGRGRALLLLVAFPPVLLELVNGNIHLFLALAIWAGLRRSGAWPASWAFVFLTKVTPGVGVLWFAARREWRQLAIALGVTVAVVIVGVVIAPSQWTAWVQSLAIAQGRPPTSIVPPLILRLPVAAAIAWYAGRTDRAWLVPVACTLAAPILWLQSTAILTACFPLYWERARWQRSRTTADPAPNAELTAEPA